MKYTLITGASSGIGYELAKVFAKHGHNLVLVATNKKKLSMQKILLEKIYNIKVEIIVENLIEDDSAKKIYDYTNNKGIIVDNLVNNAGFGYHSIYVSQDYSKQYEMVKVNILTLMELTYLYGKDMKDRKNGKILNIASLASLIPGPYMATYYASKAFVLSFSLSLKEELKEYNVSVTTILPPPVNTNFEDTANLKDSYMFKLFIPAKPKNVAKYAYKMMQKRKEIGYYSLYTKMGNIISRLMPRCITAKFAKFINQKPKHCE